MKILAVSVAVTALVACSGTDAPPPDRPPSTVSFGGTDSLLYVDVADDAEERRRGLMGVESLPADEGMVFVFDEPVSSTFWMKNTLVPLSIAFVDGDDRVIGVLDMHPCQADPCPSYGINEQYVLAIEANLGWFEDHGIQAGDQAELRVSAYG